MGVFLLVISLLMSVGLWSLGFAKRMVFESMELGNNTGNTSQKLGHVGQYNFRRLTEVYGILKILPG